jgi:hypothetical protein
MAVVIGGPLLLQALPTSMRDAVARTLLTANWALVGGMAALVGVAVDAVLLAVGIVRFQRTRLILE